MDLSLKDVFSVIVRRWYIELAIILMFVVGGVVLSTVLVSKEYSSTTRAYVFAEITSPTAISMGDANATLNAVAEASADDFYVTLAERLQAKGFNEISGGKIKSAISVIRVNTNLNILEISCTWSDAYSAQRILTEFNVFLAESLFTLPFDSQRIIYDVRSQPSLNLNPVSPSVVLWTLVAFALGVVVAAAVVVLVEFNNDRVRNANDLSDKLDTVVLADIPQYYKRHKQAYYANGTRHTHKVSVVPSGKTQLISDEKVSFAFKEAFNSLAVGLIYVFTGKETKKISVTSANASSGKSTASVNLAIALAHLGYKVLLVDNDFRNPVLHTYLGVSVGKGLSDAICTGLDKEDIVVKTSIENLDLVPAGTIPPEPQRILMSNDYKNMLDLIGQDYQWVIVDTPPINVVSDAVVINGYVNGSVLLVNKQKDYVADVQKAKEKLGTKLIGLVINDTYARTRKKYFGSSSADGYNA